MMMVGCDFHPSVQQIAFLDTESGEIEEKSLTHASGEAGQFYGQLARPALVGMEAVGNSQWFVGWLERLGLARIQEIARANGKKGGRPPKVRKGES